MLVDPVFISPGSERPFTTGFAADLRAVRRRRLRHRRGQRQSDVTLAGP